MTKFSYQLITAKYAKYCMKLYLTRQQFHNSYSLIALRILGSTEKRNDVELINEKHVTSHMISLWHHWAVSAKFIGPSDRQDKYVIGPICLISSRTEMSDVASSTMYTIYTQSQTDICSVLWNVSPNRTKCPMKFCKVSRTLHWDLLNSYFCIHVDFVCKLRNIHISHSLYLGNRGWVGEVTRLWGKGAKIEGGGGEADRGEGRYQTHPRGQGNTVRLSQHGMSCLSLLWLNRDGN